MHFQHVGVAFFFAIVLVLIDENDNVLAFQPIYKPHYESSFVKPKTPWTRILHRPSSSSSSSSSARLASSQSQSVKELILEKLPSKSVVDAVAAAATSKGGIVASDVAAAAGVSLFQAKQDLTALAALTRADLAVTSDGELVYRFPSNIPAALAQNSAKYQALATFRKVWPALFWVVRVSFGVALLASLVAIFSTIFFIQSSSSSSSDDDRRRDNRGGGGGFFGMGGGYWGPSPFDAFYFRPYGSYGYYGSTDSGAYRDPDQMGFLESIFSYLFGDGDPNEGMEQRRLSMAAAVIRNSQGAITAEQLAPFCDDAPSPAQQETANYVDESFVLPIVSALGGEPVVTDDGEIVYVFSELQTTSTSTSSLSTSIQSNNFPNREATVLKRAGMKPNSSAREIAQVLNYNGISTRGAVEKRDLIQLLEQALPPAAPSDETDLDDPLVLQEREYTFSLAPEINKFLAAGLGVVNLGGALYLGNLLSQVASYGARLPSYFGTVQALYPLLLGYAVFFNAIPAARNFYIQRQNEQIRQRNARRSSWKSALSNAIRGNNRIAKKLQAAARFKTKVRQIGDSKSNIIYDTSQPIEDATLQKDRVALEEFDKLLREGEDNAFQ